MARRPQLNTENSVDLLWNPRQMEFLAAVDAKDPSGKHLFDRCSLFSGRQGGKTKIGGIAIGKLAMEKPNQYGWVCAPTYDDLFDFVYPAVFSVIPDAWVQDWIASHRVLILKNGTRIAFRSLDDPNKARGPTLDFMWIDEARKVSEDAYYTALPALVRKSGICLITTTPNGFDWCYDAFWKPAEEGEEGYWACKYKTIDNPSINPREIERSRRIMDPVFFAQEYEADFVTFTGSIYGAQLEPQILSAEIDIRRILPEYPRLDGSRPGIVGLDPGADHPFAGAYLVNTGAMGLVVVGEYAERNRSIRQHVDGIGQMIYLRTEANQVNIERYVMDRTQRQTFIEIGQYGINPIPADQADVVEGIRRVQSWLSARRLWFVQPWCPKLVSDLRSYRWAEGKNGKGETLKERPIKRKDDLPDALRYAVMGWPELPAWEQDIDPARAFVRRGATPEEQWMFDRVAALNKAERYPAQQKQGIGDFYTESREPDIDESQQITDSLWHSERMYGDDY
jgi:PBSX family phage terminase large subunit